MVSGQCSSVKPIKNNLALDRNQKKKKNEPQDRLLTLTKVFENHCES